MLTRNRSMHLLALILALGAVLLNVPLASSQGLTVTVAAVDGDLPLTAPDSDLWQRATAVEVPLSAQMILKPMQPETNIHAITVRGLHNGETLALMLEWADATRNESTFRPEDFRDGVAVQFPLADIPPFFCMGQQGGNVNIWHWKADWQAVIAAGKDLREVFPNMYVDQYPFTAAGEDVVAAAYEDVNYLTAHAAANLMAAPAHQTPVENLIAGGAGALTGLPVDRQIVQGHGVWQDGVWRVIFSRNLTAAEQEDVVLQTDQVYSVAFAAWDGENEERNGTKSTSQWVSLELSSSPAAPAASAPAAVAAASTSGNASDNSDALALWVFLALMAFTSVVVAAVAFYVFLGSPTEAD